MKRTRSRLMAFAVYCLTGCLWANTGKAAGIEPFHWGMTPEELTQVLSKGGSSDSILREDSDRSRIELPFAPLKSLKISRGRLLALVEVKKSAGPESLGKLFGYAYDGRFFGRVELLSQTPGTSLQEVIRGLKERFPEGKVFRSFSGPKPVIYFEYRGSDLYVFTNEAGVYYFEPLTLNKVLREEQKVRDEKESKDIEGTRELLRTP